ncbi:MAG: hypothetical protein BGO03_09530 [Mesorhizobium sp. 61-13]|jgi:hypothetical protein|nr:MAG: hypothetical protein BGO03_09530 [Mesorhizobium sp. 61-13]
MAQQPQPKPRSADNNSTDTRDPEQVLLRCAYDADIDGVIAALKAGADVNTTDPVMGLTALHIAVGTNNLALTRILVEDWKAEFKPDGTGRWPTSIAAHARVDEALCDYIVEAEEKVLYPE